MRVMRRGNRHSSKLSSATSLNRRLWLRRKRSSVSFGPWRMTLGVRWTSNRSSGTTSTVSGWMTCLARRSRVSVTVCIVLKGRLRFCLVTYRKRWQCVGGSKRRADRPRDSSGDCCGSIRHRMQKGSGGDDDGRAVRMFDGGPVLHDGADVTMSSPSLLTVPRRADEAPLGHDCLGDGVDEKAVSMSALLEPSLDGAFGGPRRPVRRPGGESPAGSHAPEKGRYRIVA